MDENLSKSFECNIGFRFIHEIKHKENKECIQNFIHFIQTSSNQQINLLPFTINENTSNSIKKCYSFLHFIEQQTNSKDSNKNESSIYIYICKDIECTIDHHTSIYNMFYISDDSFYKLLSLFHPIKKEDKDRKEDKKGPEMKNKKLYFIDQKSSFIAA